MTHILTHAVAWGLYKMRRDVGRLPFGTFRNAKEIGVTVLVDVQGGKDLVPMTLWDCHKMSLKEVAQKTIERVQKAKKGKDEEHNKGTAMANYIPSFIAQPIGFAMTYIAAVVGISLGPGLRKNSFGHLVVTNVGTMGLPMGFAPLCPPVHQLGLMCFGAIEKRAVVDTNDGDKIKVAKMCTAVGTGDHRYGDAAIFVPFFGALKGYVEDPENFDETKFKENARYDELKDK